MHGACLWLRVRRAGKQRGCEPETAQLTLRHSRCAQRTDGDDHDLERLVQHPGAYGAQQRGLVAVDRGHDDGHLRSAPLVVRPRRLNAVTAASNRQEEPDRAAPEPCTAHARAAGVNNTCSARDRGIGEGVRAREAGSSASQNIGQHAAARPRPNKCWASSQLLAPRPGTQRPRLSQFCSTSRQGPTVIRKRPRVPCTRPRRANALHACDCTKRPATRALKNDNGSAAALARSARRRPFKAASNSQSAGDADRPARAGGAPAARCSNAPMRAPAAQDAPSSARSAPRRARGLPRLRRAAAVAGSGPSKQTS